MCLKQQLSEFGLDTDIGKFILSERSSLGEGGNSHVYSFYREDVHGIRKDFAIKFLKNINNDKQGKLNRFIDEFFCGVQLDYSPNIVKTYHFDKVKVGNNEYYIIIMKKYSGSLKSRYENLKKEPNFSLNEEKEKLQNDLFRALHFLHSNKIIHRDIKPENIFYDEETNNYVLGDLGIAFFDPEKFSRVSETPKGERIANYLFSAPEQREKGRGEITFSADIYALGQVLYWFEYGKTYQGTGGVTNRVLHKCLQEDPNLRFQSISDIQKFIEAEKQPKVDHWKAIRHLDETIRSTFTKIDRLEVVDNHQKINKFLQSFLTYKRLEDYLWMDHRGGDLQLTGLEYLEDKWLLNEEREIEIEKMIIYKDVYSIYNNFFILLIKPSEEFKFFDENGIEVLRDTNSGKEDTAYFWDGKYIPYEDARNGYYEYELEGKTIVVNAREFELRHRYINKTKSAYIFAPVGTGLDSVHWTIPKKFLEKILQDNNCELSVVVDNYMKELRENSSLAYEVQLGL